MLVVNVKLYHSVTGEPAPPPVGAGTDTVVAGADVETPPPGSAARAPPGSPRRLGPASPRGPTRAGRGRPAVGCGLIRAPGRCNASGGPAPHQKPAPPPPPPPAPPPR